MADDKYQRIIRDARAGLTADGAFGLITFFYARRNEVWTYSRMPTDTRVANGARVLKWPLLKLKRKGRG